MTGISFADNLRDRIEAEYRRRGDTLGWRFLASPASVLDGARVALIGLMPGGKHDREDHPRFSMTKGSAYVDEVWEQGKAAGKSKLQIQVRALCAEIGEPPEAVLAGHLVPFRSSSWKKLSFPDDAVKFGTSIWAEILAHARPHIVITMGAETADVIGGIVGARDIGKHQVGWGSISAQRGWFLRSDGSEGAFIGLPHLSRFSVFRRPKQRGLTEIRRLLEGVDRIGSLRSRDRNTGASF